MRLPLQRRTFLRGAGVAIALPMLEAMTPPSHGAENAPQRVKRFVCLSNNYGVYREAFFPAADQAGADYDMPETLAPLEKHRRDVTVFSNLDHGNTGGHKGVPVLLSGVPPHVAHPASERSQSHQLHPHWRAGSRDGFATNLPRFVH